MHQLIENVKRKLGIEIPEIEFAYQKSEQIIKQSKEFFKKRKEISPDSNKQTDIVFFGSLARFEATAASDLDYLVVAYDLPPEGQVNQMRNLIRTTDELCRQLNLNGPGATGMFGTVIGASDLTEKIGLEQDTNLNQSRRLLLLQESISIYNEQLHNKLISCIIERYLNDYKMPKKGIPRFLLNDTIRYWRTIAVDYQAKRWNNNNLNWGLRYLKLIISRKIVFAGMMISLLLTKKATKNYFLKQFRLPSLARLAQLLNYSEFKHSKDLSSIFVIYDRFLGYLKDEDFREAAKGVDSSDRFKIDNRLQQIKEDGVKLQKNLENIFFRDSLLKANAVKYMSF